MTSWFDFLRDKAAKVRAAQAAAAEIAAQPDWQGGAVWAALGDVDLVPRVFAAVAERDPGVAFALDRARRALGNDAMALRGLLDEGVGAAGAWLAHQLYTDRAPRVARLLLQGIDLGAPVVQRVAPDA